MKKPVKYTREGTIANAILDRIVHNAYRLEYFFD